MRQSALYLHPAQNSSSIGPFDGVSVVNPIPTVSLATGGNELWLLLLFPALIGLAIMLIVQRRRLTIERKKMAQAHLASIGVQVALRKAQQALHSAQELAREASEAEGKKSELLVRMSYSIRSNLNGILGYITLIRDNEIAPSVRNQYIDIILRRGQNLLSLSHDVRCITQIESNEVIVKPEACDLNQLLEAIRLRYSTDASARRGRPVTISVVNPLPEPMCWVMLDPHRLEQVLSNLLDNAFRHTKQGAIEFGYRLMQHNRIQFHVKDTGSGIPAHLQDRIFNDYCLPHQADDQDEYLGTGLGLTLCKAIVERMEGVIGFESTEGKGATFFFHLPFVPAKPLLGRHISRSLLATHRLDLNERVILVVEDDLISFQLIDILLRPTGARVIHVKNGEDALEVCHLMERIDLVLMDMQLPFMNGYEATQRIKSLMPAIPVIAQTANTLGIDRQRCLAAGCTDYLTKPIDSDELLLCIANRIG